MELHSINENNFEMKAPTMSSFNYRQFFAGLLPNIDVSLDLRKMTLNPDSNSHLISKLHKLHLLSQMVHWAINIEYYSHKIAVETIQSRK